MLCVSCYMVLCGASWVAQLVKNPHAMKETPVQFLGREDPLEESMVTDSSILAWRIPLDRGAWLATVRGVAESQTEQLSIEAGIILTHMRKVQRGFVVLETA